MKLSKLITLTALTLTLTACGQREYVSTQLIQAKDGQSCHAESVPGGLNIICGDDVAFIPHGNDGQDGANGIDGQDGKDGVDGIDGTFQGYVEFREVCPENNPQDLMETLLYLDGQYMAYLTANNWKNQRLVVLSEGVQYMTTDGREQVFSIVDGEIVCF